MVLEMSFVMIMLYVAWLLHYAAMSKAIRYRQAQEVRLRRVQVVVVVVVPHLRLRPCLRRPTLKQDPSDEEYSPIEQRFL